jgi:hypothetical protein
MSEMRTKDWMERNHLKSVTVYFHEMIFERVQAAAKANGCSKGNWVHNIVIERLRKCVNQ